MPWRTQKYGRHSLSTQTTKIFAIIDVKPKVVFSDLVISRQATGNRGRSIPEVRCSRVYTVEVWAPGVHCLQALGLGEQEEEGGFFRLARPCCCSCGRRVLQARLPLDILRVWRVREKEQRLVSAVGPELGKDRSTGQSGCEMLRWRCLHCHMTLLTFVCLWHGWTTRVLLFVVNLTWFVGDHLSWKSKLVEGVAVQD